MAICFIATENGKAVASVMLYLASRAKYGRRDGCRITICRCLYYKHYLREVEAVAPHAIPKRATIMLCVKWKQQLPTRSLNGLPMTLLLQCGVVKHCVMMQPCKKRKKQVRMPLLKCQGGCEMCQWCQRKHHCKGKKPHAIPPIFIAHMEIVFVRRALCQCDLLCNRRSRSLFRLYELHSNRI